MYVISERFSNCRDVTTQLHDCGAALLRIAESLLTPSQGSSQSGHLQSNASSSLLLPPSSIPTSLLLPTPPVSSLPIQVSSSLLRPLPETSSGTLAVSCAVSGAVSSGAVSSGAVPSGAVSSGAGPVSSYLGGMYVSVSCVLLVSS